MVSYEDENGDGDEVSIGLFICWAELVVIDGVSIALFWPSPALGESGNVKQPAVIYESLFGSEGHFSVFVSYFSLFVILCLLQKKQKKSSILRGASQKKSKKRPPKWRSLFFFYFLLEL